MSNGVNSPIFLFLSHKNHSSSIISVVYNLFVYVIKKEENIEKKGQKELLFYSFS